MTLRLLSIFLACVLSLNAQQPNLTLDKIFGQGYFASKAVPGFNFMKDNNYYSKVIRDEKDPIDFRIVQMDIRTNQEVATLFDTKIINHNIDSSFRKLDFSHYELSSDEQQILLFYEGESIYRHSAKYLTYIYNRKTQLLSKIDNDKILHASLNAQGDKVVFVKENNLYFKDLLTGATKAITTDGKWNHIINGNCDWVYEEEFSFTKAFEIAPDGQSVAFYRFDESKVPEFVMTKYDALYPTPYSFKYPKAGDANSEIKIVHYDFNTSVSSTAYDATGRDMYIPRIRWVNDKELCIQLLNRHQNQLQYLVFDKTKGKDANTIMLEEKNPYYIEISDQYHFATRTPTLLYLSEQDGWNRIYIYDRIKRSKQALSPPNQDVNELVGYDEAKGKLYYTSCASNPYFQHLYQYDFRTKKNTQITEGNYWHSVTASPNLQYFLVNQSNFYTVPQYRLINASGKTIQHLEQNDQLSSRLKEYKWGSIVHDSALSADQSYMLYGYLIYPPDFDPSKKYPVLMYQYSGPGSQEVRSRFPASGHYYWHQYLAQQGYIIACYDPRGTGSRGQAFKKATYLQLGKYESDDMIAIARTLGARHYVDKGRIGIWGWSYGGFMAATCILKGHDVFKTAISVAPVTNWRYYDNIYTERYMRTPAENEGGYDDNAPDRMASKLKGNLLIIHGTSDDNVHFQNAASLTEQLIEEKKDFESFYYPNKDHSIRGRNTRWHLYHKMSKYILEHL